MAADTPLYVAREADLSALNNHWEAASNGTPTFVRVQAPFGGGRRALVGSFLRDVSANGQDALVWRVAPADQENGVQWLMRMYGSLIAHITSDVLRRGKAEMILTSQLPKQTTRVQNWYQQFIDAMKESKTDTEKGSVQLKIPQDNPLIGLIEVVNGLARKMPVILEVQAPASVHSVLPGQFLAGLMTEAKSAGSKLMVVLHDEPESDTTRSCYPSALLDFYNFASDDIQTLTIEPWGVDEVGKFLAARGIESDAAQLARITGGRPGYLAELVDILGEKDMLRADLSEVTLASLVPMDVDTDDLEIPEDSDTAEGQRRHAGPDDAGTIAYLAALLGQAFPSSLVADMGGFDRESVDDMLDAMGGLFEEVQYSEEMQTWLYKFTKGTWREGVMEANDNEKGHQIGRNVGLFMERFLSGRGYVFVGRTARTYAEHSAYSRASMMRARALNMDAPDAWGMAYEMLRYFDEIKWNDQMVRTIYTSLLDNLVNHGNLKAADQVHAQVSEYATEKEDRPLQAWLLLNGSKLDFRRQDLYRARDRARDALTMYQALENNGAQAEVKIHLANIELADGNNQAAMTEAREALDLGSTRDESDENKATVSAHIMAQAELVRGIVARRAGQNEEAIKSFQRANEAASQAQQGGIALDAGVRLGEALIANRQAQDAANVLNRVLQLAKQSGAAQIERQASQLMANLMAASGQMENALQLAQRVLQLSSQMRLEPAIPGDLHNVGAFLLGLNKPGEALAYFKQAEQRLTGAPEGHPLKRDLNYHMGIACLQTNDFGGAKTALSAALPAIAATKDARRIMSVHSGLARIEEQSGDKAAAMKHLEQALAIAKANDLKDERRQIKKQLEAMA